MFIQPQSIYGIKSVSGREPWEQALTMQESLFVKTYTLLKYVPGHLESPYASLGREQRAKIKTVPRRHCVYKYVRINNIISKEKKIMQISAIEGSERSLQPNTYLLT